MNKGKFGISPAAIAVLAFCFCILRQPTAILLVCGFALAAEKDKWLNRQVLQALILSVEYSLADLVLDWIFGGLSRFFSWVELYRAASAISQTGSVISSILYIAFVVLAALAILQVMKGNEAAVPIVPKAAIDGLSALGHGVAPAPQAPMGGQPYGTPSPQMASVNRAPQAAPMQSASNAVPVPGNKAPQPQMQAASMQSAPNPQVQATPAPQAPGQTASAQDAPKPQAPAAVCPNCSAPLRDDSVFCAECGTKVK